ncbi:MAG: hypothetical protein Q7R91_01800 [bacterium]|nr:hypothetical protein [bacterium]
MDDETDDNSTPTPSCGRCRWEASDWPEKLKQQTPLSVLAPCGHLGNIPGCYYCGTKDDVALCYYY